ncbi:MAG: MFS transporter [Treponema sp.]|nr:MAG: MFS transporter [Treponema sp.]
MELWKRNLWVLWCTQIIALASFGFGVPFIPLYIKDLQPLSPEQVKIYATILAGAPAVLMGIMAPVWGFISDKYGRKLMLLRAMIGGVILITLMGTVSSVNQLLVLRFAQGMFTGSVTASLAFVSSGTPEKHLSYALGVISSSNFIGFSLGPAIGGIFAEIYGYRMSFYIGGALMLIGVILVLFFVKEDKQLLQARDKKVSMRASYKAILKPVIISILILLLFLRITRAMFSPYLPLFIESKLLREEGVSFITGIVNALIGFTVAISSMLIGKFVANRNKIKTVIGLFIISFVMSILVINYSKIATFFGVGNSLIVFIVLYVIMYFHLGGIEPVITALAAANITPENRGALSGLQGMISSIGWALAPVISGTIVYGRSVEFALFAIPVIIVVNIGLSLWLEKVSNKHVA